jgi:hypothetical protein
VHGHGRDAYMDQEQIREVDETESKQPVDSLRKPVIRVVGDDVILPIEVWQQYVRTANKFYNKAVACEQHHSSRPT